MGKKKIKTLPPEITDDEVIEYAIYCRKSTDESSNKQVASIPRQIIECLRFADRENLKIASKPKDFSKFESEKDIFKEDHCEDIADQKVYQETRNLFIIKEQESAKIPANRKKWKKLTHLILEGKIRGLLSYSPDRQARNMLEGGELIDFVDNRILDLKYANFHFEPNASGKMMLGIWFVFSKQYSDKLSEDVSAGNKRAIEKGETIGQLKHGYIRGKNNRWKKDPRNSKILRKAFELKIEENLSNEKIAKYMNDAGYRYNWGKENDRKISPQKLSKIWTDPFYYGEWIVAQKSPVDLRDVDPEFEPLISEVEHSILSERSQKTLIERRKRDINNNDDLESVRVIENGFLHDTDGNEFCVTLPNKKQRHFPNLEELKKKKKDAILADVVKPHQIKLYNNRTKKIVGFDKLDKKIREKISKLRMTDEQYVAYLSYAKEYLQDIFDRNDIERKENQLQINRLRTEKGKFETDNLNHLNRTPEQEELYQKRKKEFLDRIEFHENEIKRIDNKEEIEILSTEAMIKLMKNAESFYDKCSYVQKARIIKILLLNVIYHHENWLEIKVRPELEELFSDFCLHGGPGES